MILLSSTPPLLSFTHTHCNINLQSCNREIIKPPNMANHSAKPTFPLMMRLKFFIGSFMLKRVMRSDGTINRRLLSLLDPKIPAAPAASPVSSSDVSVDPSRDLWFRLFVPSSSTAQKLPLITYFHGGGFSCFSPHSKSCHELCRALAARIPAVVASVNYRLAPEHKYPCQYDDGFDALKFINDANRDVLPPCADLRRCFLAGDSAGGNIAHHVAVRAGLDGIELAGIVAVQPFFGGEERTEAEVRLAKGPVLTAEGADALWRMFLPAGADRNHAAVNVFGGGGGDERVRSVEFPRALVVVGGADPVQDWQRRYAEGLKRCGKQVELVEYANAFHGFYAFQDLPEFEFLLRDVRAFINKH
ncbi:probable carboxylesterase 18 [Salvia miltiorrhiza]|uniref:probable carboxylesterase 18 n=1 Tax=Salvia miltiorrhiza TaxID=226208 RepID=UPI0025ABA957|nr:probable carboxylesterase 18 [Salvia miltiorrhiza]